MFIVDSQVHVWSANTPERPWPTGKNPPHRPVPFTKDDLLREMDTAGVSRAVLIPPGWIGNNLTALEAAQQHLDRLGLFGRFDADAPNARGQLATWRKTPGMLGMRYAFEGDPKDDWVAAEAGAAKVPMMLSAGGDLRLIERAAERNPEVKLMIDHFGIPHRKGKKDEAAFADLDGVIALAKRPNIAVKASSLPSYTTWSYPFEKLQPYIRRVYDAFGPKRMFWGTDLTKMPCTYRQAVTMFTEEIPWLTSQDKEWIMGRGLCEWIDWKLP